MSFLRNRIWAELTQSKHNIEFALNYSHLQRKRIRYFNTAILIFSTGGIMGWKFWDNFPALACAIIALFSIVRLIKPQILMDDKMLKNLDDIHRFYVGYHNKLEMLWLDYDEDRLTKEKAQEIFYSIKDLETDINSVIAVTVKSAPEKIIKICKINSDTYFKQIFNT